jgi:hypothetical protein
MHSWRIFNKRMISISHPVIKYTETHGCRANHIPRIFILTGSPPVRCVCKQQVAHRVATAKRGTILINCEILKIKLN